MGDNPNSLDTNLVCMFKESSSNCPAMVERVKSSIESNIASMEPTYSKYANFPSCSSSDWASRYWGQSFSQLQEIKDEWDPGNIFDHLSASTNNGVSNMQHNNWPDVRLPLHIQ